MKTIQLLLTNILLVSTIGILPAQGQASFNMLWRDGYQHTSNNNFSNEVREIVTNQSTGDFFMLADFTSNVDMGGTPTATTYNYTAVLKYDINGVFQYQKLFDVGQHNVIGFERKSGFALEIDQAGNVYAGYTTFNSSTDYDLKVTKLDPSLNVLWTHTYNALSKDDGVDLVVSPTAVAYAIVKSGTAATNYRYRLIKAASNLTSTAAFYSFPLGDHPASMTMDAAGNFYYTGHRVQSNGGGNAVLTGSLTSTGSSATVRWARADDIGGGSGDDIGRYITIGADGFAYVAGSAQGPVQHGQDAITMKYATSNGKLQWTNVINFTLSDGAFFVEVPDISNVYTGWKGGNAVYVDRISAVGGLYTGRGVYNPVPQGPYTSISGVSLEDMSISPSKGIYVSGTVSANNGSQALQAVYIAKFNFQARSTGNLAPSVLAPVEGDFQESRANMQMVLNNSFKKIYTACNNARDNANHQQEAIEFSAWESPNTFRLQEQESIQAVDVYPNPSADGTFQFNTSLGARQVRVTDLTGRVVESLDFSDLKHDFSLNLTHCVKGTYLVEVIGFEGHSEIVKILID
ncbi:MAG: T9SS type A sorting domain-containing protein [Bacteroidota bacterium]